MEPWVLAGLLGTTFGVAALVSPIVRSLLRAIFRRPRDTSVIVNVGGKNTVTHRPSRLEGRALRKAMRKSARRPEEPADGVQADGVQAGTGDDLYE